MVTLAAVIGVLNMCLQAGVRVIVTQVPAVVRSVMIAGVLASAMSSLTSALTAISSVAVMDLVRPLLLREETSGRVVALGRVATLITGVALMGSPGGPRTRRWSSTWSFGSRASSPAPSRDPCFFPCGPGIGKEPLR